MKKAGYVLLSLMAITIGVYPIVYFLVDVRFGLLETKTPALLADGMWNAFFYVHIVTGAIALLTGWPQFSRSFRNRRMQLHRNMGKVYTGSVVLSGLSGLYIAFYATGGIIAATGFAAMSVAWLVTTVMAYQLVRRRNIRQHQVMMMYSYAVCFAAVTLRIELPLFTLLLGSFTPAYQLVAWLSWTLNVVFVWLYLKRKAPRAAVMPVLDR